MRSVPTSPRALDPDNPHWDTETSSVYFADYFDKLLFRYSLTENKMYTLTVDGVINPAFFVLLKNSKTQYLTTTNGSAVVINWNGHSHHGRIERTVFTVAPNTIINSAYFGPTGDILLGNYGPGYCSVQPVFSFCKYTVEAGLVETARHFQSTVGITVFHVDGCTQILR